MSFFRASEAATGVEAIEVNPANPAFAEDAGPLIHMNSIVPKLMVKFSITMAKAAIVTDAMRAIKVNYMPLYFSFLDTLEAEDTKTAVQIEDILEMQHDTTNKDTYPLYSATDLNSGILPFSTVVATEVFGDYGLTTNINAESVSFDDELFWDAQQYYSNRGMLRKVTGGWKTAIVTRDRPFNYFSNNFTYPTVKRGNPYTYCGMLFHLPLGGDSEQFFDAADTTDIPHVVIRGRVRFNEWNPDFDQTAF